MSLKQQLIDRIRKEGPLSVADYMSLVCTHYYNSRDPFGAEGDFTTSPEISQIFGELLGAWVADCWQRLGSPRAELVELGPGRGTLMKDMLRATRNIKGFHDALSIHMIETSKHLSALQKETLQGLHPHISWHTSFDFLSTAPLLLVANEFFDALPIHQHMKIDHSWQERSIGFTNGELEWEPAGEVFCESSPISANIMARIAAHIHTYSGAALIIDYGYTGGSRGDTLQALHKHQYVDTLSIPGDADITAHVDFDTLIHTAKGRGAQTWGAVEQGTFLKRLGAELRATALCKQAAPAQQQTILAGLERLVAPEQMGALFKVIAVTSSEEAPAGF